MAEIDPERFSELTNALQQAVLLSQQRVALARAASEHADELDAAIRRAAVAARRLRPSNGGQA